MARKTLKKSLKKSLKGGIRLETVLPRGGRNDEEYATFLEGRRLPEYQWRVPPRRNGERNTAYIGRVRRNAVRVRHSPIDEDHPYPPTPPTTPQTRIRRRNKTKSAPAVNKKKSRRSSMKLAAKGSYKRKRNSAPTRRKLSSAKAKDYLRILKKR